MKTVVGWREWVGLPALAVLAVRAKIDIGVRNAALHVVSSRTRLADGVETATLGIHPEHGAAHFDVEAEVAGTRWVRTPGGRREERPDIVTDLALGIVTVRVPVTLTSRDDMGFPMLVGRHVLRRRFLVNPARSYLLGASVVLR